MIGDVIACGTVGGVVVAGVVDVVVRGIVGGIGIAGVGVVDAAAGAEVVLGIGHGVGIVVVAEPGNITRSP